MIKLPYSDMLPCGVCDFSRVGELISCRAKQRIPQDSKSVIVYLFPYFLGEEYYENSNVSKYAVPEDYHLVVGSYLQKIAEQLKDEYPDNKFQHFCDNSPVREVDAAVLCGLGVKGRNGLLINPEYGSFCFIGEIVTDLEMECSLPEDRTCLGCGACEKVCPGNAIGGYRVDVDKCLSHISQLKGELSLQQKALIAQSPVIWGCDACQNACPMNRNIKKSPIKEFYETAMPVFRKGDSIETRAFGWRGRAVIERNFEIKYCKEN